MQTVRVASIAASGSVQLSGTMSFRQTRELIFDDSDVPITGGNVPMAPVVWSSSSTLSNSIGDLDVKIRGKPLGGHYEI